MHKAEGQHTARGVLTIHPGRCQELEVSYLLAYDTGVISLQPEIQLLVQAAFQFTHYEHNTITFAERSILRGKASYLVQNFNIDLNALAHARTLYLDRYLVA